TCAQLTKCSLVLHTSAGKSCCKWGVDSHGAPWGGGVLHRLDVSNTTINEGSDGCDRKTIFRALGLTSISISGPTIRRAFAISTVAWPSRTNTIRSRDVGVAATSSRAPARDKSQNVARIV